MKSKEVDVKHESRVDSAGPPDKAHGLPQSQDITHVNGLLSTIVSYIPHSLMRLLLSPSFREGEPTRYTLDAAVLFADVSGFSNLTDALVEKGDEGSEEITRLLNACFGRLIAELEAEGGDVVKFSGDALTILFSAEEEPLSHAIRRASQAAEAMQRSMREISAELDVNLELKIGIGAGEVWTFQVGGVFRRWEYVLTGPGVLQAFEAEGQTERGGITVLEAARTQMHPSPLAPKPLMRPSLGIESEQEKAIPRLVNFVPGAVRSWMVHEELHDWLGVLRTMSVLFIGLGGIDYGEEKALSQLQTFLKDAQRAIYRYQGSINKLVVDDKGTILMVLFGAPPFAHADSPLRAVRCAMDLQGVAKASGLEMRTGVTTGRVFAGPVGSDLRREYTVMGQAVNLAARLMGKAPMGETFCDPETYRWTRNEALFAEHPPTYLKGLADPIAIFQPQGLTDSASSTTRVDFPLQGRESELQHLLKLARSVAGGRSATFLLEGEAGIGKSRLLRELRQIVTEEQMVWLKGNGESLESLQSYHVWKRIVRDFFGLQALDSEQQQQSQIHRMVEGLAPELLPRLPLLNELLGLHFEETEVTSTLESSLRPQALGAMLLSLMETRALSMPVCLVLEDLQWLDSLSWELVHLFQRALRASNAPIFLLLTAQPQGEKALAASQLNTLKKADGLVLQTLTPLSRENQDAIAASLLQTSRSELPEELLTLLQKRAAGNPLYVQEWLRYVQQKGWLHLHPEQSPSCTFEMGSEILEQELPDTLEGLLLARIDTLAPELQLVLKVAAVQGRRVSLAPMRKALEVTSERVAQTLDEVLEKLVQKGLLRQKGSGEYAIFRFQHLLLQEVSYRSLLYKQRRQLHQLTALWLEQHNALEATASLSLDSTPPEVETTALTSLVHHWNQAGVESRELHFVCLAAAEATRQYANTEAIRHTTRALELAETIDPSRRYELLLRRESLLHTIGEREQQRMDLELLQTLVDKETTPDRQLEVWLRASTLEHNVSNVEKAIQLAESARALAQAQSAPAREADALHRLGSALLHKGQGEEAESVLNEALTLAEKAAAREVEAPCLRVLGIVHAQRGNYAQALKNFERVQILLSEQGQQSERIKVLSNIGLACQHLKQLERAVEALQTALELCKKVGAQSLQGRVMANLASTLISEGDFGEAYHLLRKSLPLSRQSGARSDECGIYMYLCENATRLGLYEDARRYGTQLIKDSQTIGHRYFEGYGYAYRGEAEMLAGHVEEARQDLNTAIEIAEDIGETSMKMDAMTVQAHLFLQQEQWEQAAALFQTTAQTYEDIGFQGQATESRAGLALALWSQGKQAEAMTLVEQVQQSLKKDSWFTMLEPFRAALLLLSILEESQPTKATLLLEAARKQMDFQLARFEDEQWKLAYLQIPHHASLHHRFSQNH